MLLSQVAHAVNGKFQGVDVRLQDVSINTRGECNGRLFVALKGDNFDAHQFVAKAEQAGAVAVMVERAVETSLPTVMVDSTHQGLIDLATWWRSQFVLPLVGITGSVGKTTVKEMLACIFAEFGQGLVTDGNLNNEIGVPLTLMRLSVNDRYAIVEMGMSNAGEIARLSHMSKPTIALINNAAAAHLDGLGSVEAVAKAKGEIFQGLEVDGIAVINRGDPFYELWTGLAKKHSVISFGLSDDADIVGHYEEKKNGLVIKIKAKGQKLKIKLNTVGEHNVRNALAAVAVAIAAKIPTENIEVGLSNFKPVSGRLNIETIGNVQVIDDTYNANPASMRAAINVLVKHSDNLMVVGDMGELGASADAEHKLLGVLAAKRGVQELFACGFYAQIVADGFGEGAIAFATQDKLVAFLNTQKLSGTILVKGSRSARMERVIEALQTQLNEATLASIRGEH